MCALDEGSSNDVAGEDLGQLNELSEGRVLI